MQLAEPAAKGKSSKGGVQVSKDLLGQGGQGVAVQGQQGEGGDPTEGIAWQRSQKIEPKVQDLQHSIDFGKQRLLQHNESYDLETIEDGMLQIFRDNMMPRCVA